MERGGHGPDLRGPRFTVCTATYDRGHTLVGVYESLERQTLRDFEWLVIDDGSTDGTRGTVERWQQRADFPIRYMYQANRGKPAAVNRGLEEARGQFFIVLDSDDRCVENALERLSDIWDSIPESDRDAFSGVTVHCMHPDGRMIGQPFSDETVDAYPYEMWARSRTLGEKWGFHRTAVLREHRYPVFPDEKFVPEGLLWNRVGARYKIRYRNEALRIYQPDAGGLNAKINRLKMESPNGSALFYSELLALPVSLGLRFAAAANYARYALHARRPPAAILRGSPRALLVAAALPIGGILWLKDRSMPW